MTTNICNRCFASVVLTEHGGLDFRDEESEEIYKKTLLCQACQDRDKENGREFQLEVPPNKSYNNCMMNEKKDKETLSQIMEEMAVDWKEFADCMPTSYEVYDDGRDEDVN